MRLLAIDVGHYSIKVLESDIAFRSVQLLNYVDIPLHKTEKLPTDEEILKALSTVREKVNLGNARIAINLPSDICSTRFLTLPFTDKRKISQALPFELEDQIPFDIEDVLIEHQIISKEGNQSKVLACIMQRKNLEKILGDWKGIGLNPDLVTIGSVSMKNLTPLRFEEYGGIYAVLDLGHAQTNISIIKEGSILFARTIPVGGFIITKELASIYKVDFEEAERAKVDQGFVLAGGELKVTEEQQKFSDSIKNGLSPLLKEIQQTFLFFKTEEKLNIDQVLITGGTSLLRNLNAYLQEELRAPVQQLSVLETLSESQIPVTPKNDAILSQAISLVLGGGTAKSGEQINFRRGEFARVKKEGLLEPQYAYLAKVASILLFLFLFNMIGKYIIYKFQYKRIENQVTKTLTQSFPNIPAAILESPQRLKGFIEKELQRKEEQEDIIGSEVTREITPLRIISELSKLTPEDIALFITDLNIVNNKVKLSGTVGSVEAVDRLFTAYKSYSHFSKPEKRGITATEVGLGQQFTFEFDTNL